MADKRILAIDSQILDAIQKCGFYTFLDFVKNYRSLAFVEPLERGDLGHTLLEVYYKLLKLGYSWNDAVEQATIKGREKYLELHLDLQTSEWVVASFQQYADFYHYDGIRVLEVEEPFSFILHEDDELIVVYEGKIDLQAEFPVLGKSIMDHKWRAMKADYNPLDNQLIGYSVHTDANLIYVNEVGLQKSYEPQKKFRRIPINIGDGVKARWIKNTIMWAKILDYNLQNNVWPQSHLKTLPLGTSQCVKCKYSRICNSENEEEMTRKLQEEFFQGEKWSAHRDKNTNGEESSA